MTQTIKQFQLNIENNKPACIAILLFSIIYPCFNIAIFLFDIVDPPMLLSPYNLLWIGFYAIIANIILLNRHTVRGIILIAINAASMFLWYLVSLMGGIGGILMSLKCSIIPFFLFWLTLFR